MHIETTGHFDIYNAIKPYKINLFFVYFNRKHSITNINAHQTGSYLIRYGQGSSNGTIFTKVSIRHYPYFCILISFKIAQLFYLLKRLVFKCFLQISMFRFLYYFLSFSFRNFDSTPNSQVLLKSLKLKV